MVDLSIVIPSRKEPYLNKTLKSLLDGAKTNIEILVTLDGDKPNDLIHDPRITYTYNEKSIGMRGAINAGLAIAKGKYVAKCDAHCAFADGYDKALIDDMRENWLMIPRRYSLHADRWDRELRMPIKDYHYFAYPTHEVKYGYCIFPQEWKQRTYERLNDPKYAIDDTMTLQGSFYLADRGYFMKHVGFLDDSPQHYSSFSGEQLEVGLKYWLSGGEVKVNKKTWYAHLFKNVNYYSKVVGANARSYKVDTRASAGWDWCSKHWVNDQEPNMVHRFSWLVNKFWPVPGWPKDKKEWKI